MPTISVVLPNFNHGTELESSLLAAATQTVAADEIVVVDDASTDGSVAVIKRLAGRFPTIRLLQNTERRGVAEAVSRGLREATGDYVVLASADERMLPNMIERLAGAAVAFPAARLFVSAYTEWWPERDETRAHGRGSELGPWYLSSAEPAYIPVERFHELLRQWFVWLGVNTAMFARSALTETGGFDPKLRWHSDWFAIYAVAFKHGFVSVPEPLALFRVSEASYSAVGMRDRAAQREVALAVQRKLLDPAFAYFRDAVARSPAVLSPFVRPTILALLARPSMYRMLLAVLRWWAAEALRGKRPAVWARLLHRGKLPQPGQLDFG